MRAIREVVCVMFLMMAASLAAEDVKKSLSFQTSGQSMWGPGSSPAPSSSRLYVIDPAKAQWNASTAGYSNFVGPSWSQDTYVFGDIEFAAQGRARSSGKLGLWFDLAVDLGSVSVTYPVTPVITFPDANSFRAGDTVTIRTSVTPGSVSEMTTQSPKWNLAARGTVQMSAAAKARLCVFECGEVGLEEFGFDTGTVDLLTVEPGDSAPSPPEKVGRYIQWTDITLPIINTTGSAAIGENLVSGGSHRFVESLSIDLANMAANLAGSPPLNDRKSVGPASFGYNILAVRPTLDVTARQSFTFDPDLKVVLRFGQPLEHWVVRTDHTSGPVAVASSVEVHAGESVQVRYPAADKQPTKIDPTFRLDNQFTSATDLDLVETLQVSSGNMNMHIPSVEVFPEFCFPAIRAFGHTIVPGWCTPSVHTDPVNVDTPALYQSTTGLGDQSVNVKSGTWTLQGFAPLTIDAFALDPENPIINLVQQTGATRNLGAGRRQVAYAFDFGNGGDVKLNDVHLEADLTTAFAAAHSFRVDRVIGCDVAANPEFDGASNKQLLAAGTSLAVGAKARVILIVSVYPKPDPPVYTLASNDDGTSPLDTLVTKSDRSDVLVGPGLIAGADDFVLFGEHFVKLDAIANTFGHVGSNDFVEVKNGNSAIIAGDLRAGRTIKVQGQITADYAYAGGIVDVVNKARLTLSGNMKQGANVPKYTLVAPAPATPLQGNVWVPDRHSDVLRPGYYGDVTVNAGATLLLEPGTYSFARLSVGSGAAIRTLGTTRAGIIHVLEPDEVRIGQNALVHGTLNAPRANVTFEERSRLEGAASARSITLRPGASAAYHVDCDRLVDPDCDGSPNCGQF